MSINLRKISNFISVRTKKQVNYMEGNRTDDTPIPEQYGGQPLALGSAILNTNTGITEYVVDGDCNAQVLANFIDVKTKKEVNFLIMNWLSSVDRPAELFGKPVAIGSRLLEADTGTLYAHYGDGDYQPIATGGGGGGQIWMFVGNVDETTTAFPTTRPSGDELVNGDYVKVASGATLPFTVEGIEFTSPKDQAVYLGGEWVLNANPFQNTKETPLQDATVESISGTAHNQKETNIEVVEKLRVNAYSVLSDLEDYLFDVYYDRIDYDYADKYFADMPVFGACSSIRKGNFFAKSHDWKYDEMANFVVHTPNKDGRYATLGVSTSITDLNNDFVKSRAYNENYRAVPLCIADGINDKGLACSIAVVPQDNGDNHNVNASVEERQKFHYMMIPRYVLDYFDNAQTAVEYLRDYVSFYMSDTSQIDVHYIVSDAEKTYVVEFINGITTIKDITANPYMTNFTLANTTLNADGSVYTPETQDATHKPTTTNNITPHGQGLERHNLIVDTYNALEDDVDFKALLEALHYTKTYDTAPVVSDPYWYSELTDETHTVDTTVADYADIKSATGSAYTTRTRDGETYQTTHSSLYNTEELTLLVMPQETDHEYNFHIPKGADLKTENVEITNSATESLDGLAVRQNEANEQFVEKIKELEPLVLIAEENQTINGYQVPKLTEDDITAVYNAQIAGKQVVIKDATENYTFAPKQVDTDTDDIYVCFDFCDVMILTYKTTADGVETDYKEYGGSSGSYIVDIDEEMEVDDVINLPEGTITTMLEKGVENTFINYRDTMYLSYILALDEGAYLFQGNWISGDSQNSLQIVLLEGDVAMCFANQANDFIKILELGIINPGDKIEITEGLFEDILRYGENCLLKGFTQFGSRTKYRILKPDYLNASGDNIITFSSIENSEELEIVKVKIYQDDTDNKYYAQMDLYDIGGEVSGGMKLVKGSDDIDCQIKSFTLSNFSYDCSVANNTPYLCRDGLWTSKDEGTTWEHIDITVSGSVWWKRVFYFNGKYFAISWNSNGYYAISEDGVNFSSATDSKFSDTSDYTGIELNGEFYLCLKNVGYSGKGKIYKTSDFTTWTEVNISSYLGYSNNISLYKMNGKAYIVVVDGTQIYKYLTTTDFVNYEVVELDTRREAKWTRCLNNKIFLIGESIYDLYVLEEGKDIYRVNCPTNYEQISISYANNTYMLFHVNGQQVLLSKDLVNWRFTRTPVNFEPTYQYGLACSNNAVYISTDALASNKLAYTFIPEYNPNNYIVQDGTQITEDVANTLYPYYPNATTEEKGFIEIATDAEVNDGVKEDVAVNPKQLKDSVKVDNTTIDKNSEEKLEVKNGAITNDKINSSLKDTSITNTSTDNKLATGKAVYDIIKIAGHTLEATIDTTTYIMTLLLKDKTGTTLSSQTIDLPLESLVLNIEYVDTTAHPKSLKITLQNGTITYVPVGDLIDGLENTANKVTTLSSSSTDTQYPSAKTVFTALKNKLDMIDNGNTNTTRSVVWALVGEGKMASIRAYLTAEESPTGNPGAFHFVGYKFTTGAGWLLAVRYTTDMWISRYTSSGWTDWKQLNAEDYNFVPYFDTGNTATTRAQIMNKLTKDYTMARANVYFSAAESPSGIASYWLCEVYRYNDQIGFIKATNFGKDIYICNKLSGSFNAWTLISKKEVDLTTSNYTTELSTANTNVGDEVCYNYVNSSTANSASGHFTRIRGTASQWSGSARIYIGSKYYLAFSMSILSSGNIQFAYIDETNALQTIDYKPSSAGEWKLIKH